MTVYNDEKYINQSVQSVLNQSYSNFSLLIINDASNDKTKNILESFCDERIHIVNLKKNIGQTSALNYGLQLINTEYVVRMDSDDISEPSRFYKLMDLVERNSYDFIGTNCIEFTDHGKQILIKKFEFCNDIYSHFFNFNTTPFVHGSLMIKYSSLKLLGFYNEKYRICADYDLYERIYFNRSKLKIYNLQEPLYFIRRHNNQLTKNKLAISETLKIKLSICKKLLINFEILNLAIVFVSVLYYVILYLRPKRK